LSERNRSVSGAGLSFQASFRALCNEVRLVLGEAFKDASRNVGGARDQMPNSEGYSSVSRVLIEQRVEFRFAEARHPVLQVSEEGVSPNVR